MGDHGEITNYKFDSSPVRGDMFIDRESKNPPEPFGGAEWILACIALLEFRSSERRMVFWFCTDL